MFFSFPVMQVESSATGARRIDGWLHPLYWRITGVRDAMMARVRSAGLVVGAVVVVAACLTIGHERAPTRQLLAVAVAMGLIALLWVLQRSAKVSAMRELPRVGSVGLPMRYRVTVRNDGSRALARAWWIERPADARPGVDEFRRQREPGEDERNRFDRTFAWFRWQWLMWRKRSFDGGAGAEEIRLVPGGEMRVTVGLVPARRGVIELADPRLLLPDPFGLLQRCVRVRCDIDRITIFPARHPLPRLELPGTEAWRQLGESDTGPAGDIGGFTGLRDYRAGDPLRRMHWRSWARTGKPMIKELEDASEPRHALLLDTCGGGDGDEVFEACVSAAASFAMLADEDRGRIDLMFVQDGVRGVRAGVGHGGSEVLLEALATVVAQRGGSLDALADAVRRDAGELGACLVVLHGWDDARAAFLKKLHGLGVALVPLVVGAGERPAGVPGHWLEARQLARDLAKLPPRLVSWD